MNPSNQPQKMPAGDGEARRRVRIAMFSVLGVHAAILLVLLIQGCRQQPGDAKAASAETNVPPTLEATNQLVSETTNPAPASSSAPVAATNTPLISTNGVVAAAATNTPAEGVMSNAPAAIMSVPTDYTIVAGDTLGKIAKTYHTTVKAILEANPGVEPTKLQIGQKVHLPAAVATASGLAEANVSGSTSGARLYTVKAGDSLFKIAGKFGTTANALREANGLKTDRIEVGQKLRIPARAVAHAALPAAPPALSTPGPKPAADQGV